MRATPNNTAANAHHGLAISGSVATAGYTVVEMFTSSRDARRWGWAGAAPALEVVRLVSETTRGFANEDHNL